MTIFTRASNASYWRGFDYFEHKRVSHINQIGNNVYTAIVSGTKEYNVAVDLDHPHKSTCNCPFTKDNHKICKHMIAVAFCVCPSEVDTATKIREDYYIELGNKEKHREQLIKDKKKEIKEYVNKLTTKELRKILYNKLINEQYDLIYNDEE